jgi:hypothetical protein
VYPRPTPGSTFVRDTAKGYTATRALDTLPQTVASPGEALFTITGGRVLVTRLVGEVTTTAIEGTNPVLSVTSAPTVGTAVVLASTVDASSLEIGGFLSVEGDGSALVKSNAGAVLATAVPTAFIVPVGSIGLISGANKTGAMKWDLTYFPLDEGAAVVGTTV